MADQRVRAPSGCTRSARPEQTEILEEGSIAMVCLFTFAASAAATLIVCIVTPASPIPAQWSPIRVDLGVKSKASSASAAS